MDGRQGRGHVIYYILPNVCAHNIAYARLYGTLVLILRRNVHMYLLSLLTVAQRRRNVAQIAALSFTFSLGAAPVQISFGIYAITEIDFFLYYFSFI